ncbi:hypothetical protein CBS101457_006030 [Exobasidium rhododendri]|nr:hypothetical protein CBS101457_006030 [Exobasidium rhododendri]
MATTHKDQYGDAAKRQAKGQPDADPEETLRRQYNAALKGGAKGATAGIAVLAPTAYILHQRWQPFRHLTLPLKTFFVTSGTIICGVIAADKAGIAFDREHYSDQGAQNMAKYHTREEKEWAELSAGDKALTWAKDNKFGVVAGSWFASMGGIFAYIHNQPMSFSQKLVQTRVWAQGLTLASLVGMAAITQIPSAGDRILREREESHDHGWRDYIGDSSADPSEKSQSKSSDTSSSSSPPSKGNGKASSSSSKSSSSPPKDDNKGSSESSSSGSSTSGDSNKNKAGKSSINEISSAKASDHAEKSSGSSDTNADSSGKSTRSAHPNAKNEKAQPTKAPASQTGTRAGYAGNN